MGIYLTICLAAALTFWPRLGRYGQLMLLGFTALSVAGIYATLTRCAWMGGGLGLAIFVGFSVPRQWRTLLLGCGGLVTVVILVAEWDSVWNLKRDVKLDASASADSAELRPILAKIAWDMFEDRPLLGCGLGQYDRERLPYLADRTSELPLEKAMPYVQHNAFLALLVETGFLGMGLFVVLFALWIRNGWRVWRATQAPLAVRQAGLLLLTLIGAYLPNAMFQDTNIIDGVSLVLFFMAGTVSGLAACIDRWSKEREPFALHAGSANVEGWQHAVA
jgi:O-antigen ligase